MSEKTLVKTQANMFEMCLVSSVLAQAAPSVKLTIENHTFLAHQNRPRRVLSLKVRKMVISVAECSRLIRNNKNTVCCHEKE